MHGGLSYKRQSRSFGIEFPHTRGGQSSTSVSRPKSVEVSPHTWGSIVTFFYCHRNLNLSHIRGS